MSDERIVEVICDAAETAELRLSQYWDDHPESNYGTEILAALRADGWELYRPEDAISHAYEIGWCHKHDDMARRYDDEPDRYSCWWEDVVEASGEHDIRDFQPVRLVPVESEDRQ